MLAPKVSGLFNLDQAAKDVTLDFFILFASIAGAVGNPGQADYAVANGFMDAFAEYRNRLVGAQQRHGKTLSLNWPLWKDGGMNIEYASEKLMMQRTGMIAMSSASGIQAFYQALACDDARIMVMEGWIARMKSTMLAGAPDAPPEQREAGLDDTVQASEKLFGKEAGKRVLAIAQDVLRDKTVQYFTKLLSTVMKLPAQRIDADAALEKYGIDSIMVVELTAQLKHVFGSLSKTLFFEYQNISELSDYFLESHRERVIELIGLERQTKQACEPDNGSDRSTQPVHTSFKSCRGLRFASVQSESGQAQGRGNVDIAIIGLSGRYPQAHNIQEFWHNLRSAKNCITEIPPERWDHRLYFDANKNTPGKTYSKWGGFLDGADRFDPLFFNISPRETHIMDPQERVFLECVFHTLCPAQRN